MWHLKYFNWFVLLKLQKLQNEMLPACRLYGTYKLWSKHRKVTLKYIMKK